MAPTFSNHAALWCSGASTEPIPVGVSFRYVPNGGDRYRFCHTEHGSHSVTIGCCTREEQGCNAAAEAGTVNCRSSRADVHICPVAALQECLGRRPPARHSAAASISAATTTDGQPPRGSLPNAKDALHHHHHHDPQLGPQCGSSSPAAAGPPGVAWGAAALPATTAEGSNMPLEPQPDGHHLSPPQPTLPYSRACAEQASSQSPSAQELVPFAAKMEPAATPRVARATGINQISTPKISRRTSTVTQKQHLQPAAPAAAPLQTFKRKSKAAAQVPPPKRPAHPSAGQAAATALFLVTTRSRPPLLHSQPPQSQASPPQASALPGHSQRQVGKKQRAMLRDSPAASSRGGRSTLDQWLTSPGRASGRSCSLAARAGRPMTAVRQVLYAAVVCLHAFMQFCSCDCMFRASMHM